MSHLCMGGEAAQVATPRLPSSSKKKLEFLPLDAVLLAAAPPAVQPKASGQEHSRSLLAD